MLTFALEGYCQSMYIYARSINMTCEPSPWTQHIISTGTFRRSSVQRRMSLSTNKLPWRFFRQWPMRLLTQPPLV